MKKIKPTKTYKFVFINEYTNEYSFGNKYDSLPEKPTDEEYRTKRTRFNCKKQTLYWFFFDVLPEELKRGPSRKSAKFTESEASIYLLARIERELKFRRSDVKRMKLTSKRKPEQANHLQYSIKRHNDLIEEYSKTAKIWRKKVKEIKASPEYLWELLRK